VRRRRLLLNLAVETEVRTGDMLHLFPERSNLLELAERRFEAVLLGRHRIGERHELLLDERERFRDSTGHRVDAGLRSRARGDRGGQND